MTSALAFSFVPPGVNDPVQFLLLGSLSMIIMGAAKSGFAGAAGLLSVPLMIYACGNDSTLAAGIMLPLLIACDYVTIVIWWRRWDVRNVLVLLPGMLVGIALGGVTLWLFLQLGKGQSGAERAVTNAALSLTIGLLAVGFVVLTAVRSLMGGLQPFRPVFWHGFAAGSAAGFTSTLTHSAGPITTMFFLAQRMPKGKLAATAVLYYWIGNQVKLIPYAILGLLTRGSLSADLTLLPAVIVGAGLGVFLHHRVNEKWFRIVMHVLLAVIGGNLAITSAAKLWG